MLYGPIVALLVLGGALAADAAVVSDEEVLDGLVDELTSADPDDRIAAVLERVDATVRLQRDGSVQEYSNDDPRLADDLGRALEPFEAADLDVVQRSVRVDGDRATVAVRARAHGRLTDASLQLALSEGSWVVTAVTAR